MSVWRDQEGILGGENYGPKIVEAIAGSSVLLLCSSRNSVGNKSVKQEVQLAWTKHVACLPLLLDGVIDYAQLEYWLHGLQYVDTSNRPASEWLPEVCKAIRNLAAGAGDVQVKRIVADGLSELRGLARFTDRIWPERYTTNPLPVTRDLGAVPASASYQFKRADRIVLRIDVEWAAHMILLDEGTSGKIYCLCPSRFCPDPSSPAGVLSVPHPNSDFPHLEASGPGGRERLLAIITEAAPPFDLMPRSPHEAAAQLDAGACERLLVWLRECPANTWEAMATEF